MPQPTKTSDSVRPVQSSRRNTFNSTRGEVLLICDEENLSPAQKLIYSKHEEETKAYKKALEAYKKDCAKLEVTGAALADLSVSGNNVVQNGVTMPKLQLQAKPLLQSQPQPQLQPQLQLQSQVQSQPQPLTQQQIIVPIQSVKKTILATPSIPQQTQLVNKTITSTIPISTNLVRTQQVVPGLVNTANSAPRTVIQVPVGTNLTGMQFVSVPRMNGNFQIVVPQANYNPLTVQPPTVPMSIQNIVVTSAASSTPVALPLVSVSKTPKTITTSTSQVVATIQPVSTVKVSQASQQSHEAPATSKSSSSTKRAAPEDSDPPKKKSKHSKSQPDVEENYYGWKQGRLWWDDEKPKGSFRCHTCNMKLATNIRYMQHVKQHLDKDHQQNCSMNNIIVCRSCYKHFASASALQRHIDRAHKYCPHRCGICESAFNDSASLMHHLSSIHKNLQMPYVCGVCNYASSIYDDLVLHFNKHHEGSKALMCPFCIRIIRCNNAFMRHCKTHLTVSIKNGLFRCHSCKLMFLNNSMLKEHMQEDHKPHQLQDRNGIPNMPMYKSKGKPPKATPVQKVSFPKQLSIKISPSLWSRREIIKPKGRLRCIECGLLTENCKEHFRKKMSCIRCNYASYCGTAFANHMIVFHKAGSAPKVHRIRKTGVNNNRILLGCRNCEFSTLSPTLMACHIESCPRGALTIESFKVRTSNLQSSRNFKQEIMSVNVKSTGKAGSDNDDGDDDVIVIDEDELVDLTNDLPSTSKDRSCKKEAVVADDLEADTTASKPKEPEMKANILTRVPQVKLEKLPSSLDLKKLQNDKDTNEDASDNNDRGRRTGIAENDNSASDDERMEVDKPNSETSKTSTTETVTHKTEPEDLESTVNGNGEASQEPSTVNQIKEIEIKQEQISAQ